MNQYMKNLTPEDRVIVKTIFVPKDNGFMRESNLKVVSPTKEKEFQIAVFYER